MLLDNIHLSKQQLQKSMEFLPDNFTAADLLEQIFLEDDVKIALQHIREGKTYAHDDVKEMIAAWGK